MSILKKFAVLSPGNYPPSASCHFIPNIRSRHFSSALTGVTDDSPLSLDFETRGDTSDEFNSYVVGVALSNGITNVYIDFKSNPDSYAELMEFLYEKQIPLIAHNVFFDASWPLRDFDAWLNWKSCTFATYRLSATEDWIGQQHGLKAAQLDLLGWTETNEVELDRWLVNAGLSKGVSKEPKDGYVFIASKLPGDGRWIAPDKGEMYQAPAEILGHYAMLDAESTWLLYKRVLQPAVRRFTGLHNYLLLYIPYIKTLIEQKLRGMTVDVEFLREFKTTVDQKIVEKTTEIINHPSLAPHLESRRQSELTEFVASRPDPYKKNKLGVEPPRLTKAGTPSKTWDKWYAKSQRAPEVNLNYAKWEIKYNELLASPLLNFGSAQQLRWLLYDKVGFVPEIFTESGECSTDEDALLGMGEIGKLLLDRRELITLSNNFVDKTLRQTWSNNTLHPSFIVPRTSTGRLGGKNPNIQQFPTKGFGVNFLKAFPARPGFKIITCDVVSLENYVLAELSRDEALWKLYGPAARPGQDAYLSNAAYLPIIGPRIRATGYDPDIATPEETAKAKKDCKAERAIGKVFTLSANYGAGPNKIQATLRAQGAIVELDDVRSMHRGFWTLYRGIKSYEQELKRVWKMTGGWVLNGIGRPIGVDTRKEKDLVNAVVQSTGHDCLVKKILITKELLDSADIEYYPFIADLHDCEMWEVRADQIDVAARIIEVDAYARLNEWLGGQIKLRGEAKICNSWYADKME